MRFLHLGSARAAVPWTLNPLVVGSIPTRPTNTFKGLARNRWAFVFSERIGSGIAVALLLGAAALLIHRYLSDPYEAR